MVQYLRKDIISYVKFTIFRKLKKEDGWVKRANFGKIKTKDRNFHAGYYGKIRL